MGVTFEWDTAKDEANRRKHGIAFREAIPAFMDPLSFTIPDPDHSTAEERFILLGQDQRGRLLVVSHTDRGDRIRIISARKADRGERRDYENG
ncbi:MAG: BrnT family toxin [Acidobacteriota bacterium]|nr:BrnT family toxin [Acidobacteriota bacterium]